MQSVYSLAKDQISTPTHLHRLVHKLLPELLCIARQRGSTAVTRRQQLSVVSLLETAKWYPAALKSITSLVNGSVFRDTIDMQGTEPRMPRIHL